MPSNEWRAHQGKRRPPTGDRLILIRLRRDSEQEAEDRQPRTASWWPKWSHDGGSGDIIAWKYASGKDAK